MFTMTMTHSVRQPYYHHQLNFVIFADAQISTSWCHNEISICKLELKTREYILSFIATVHNKHVDCMLHIAFYISTHALTCLFQISCFSFCFVSAVIESGQVIPLHIASVDSMADFGTALECLYVTHSMLHIDCYT